MDFEQSIQYLQSVEGENQKLVLENIQRIIDRFPHDLSVLSCVQVAGTNGKGSTSSYLAFALRQAGFQVGLFTSPHLQDVRERIQVNGRPISRNDFASGLSEVRRLCEGLVGEGVIPSPPSFFEYLFLLCLRHFLRRQVEWAVLEVGLGGRLDATSTIRHRVSVITNISRDHTNILGKTIAQIAREKAGIIRRHVPVVCGCSPDHPAFALIRAAAEKRGAPFVPVFAPPAALTWQNGGRTSRCRYTDGSRELDFRIRLQGEHQCRNAAVALRTLSVLRDQGLPLSDTQVAEGLRRTRLPARIEWIPARREMPGIILDGGHNPEGIRALSSHLKQRHLAPCTLIFGVLRDKEYRTMARHIAAAADTVILTRPPSPRALDPEKLVPFFKGKRVIVEENSVRALEIAKKIKKDIIVTGSLYLAGEMRTLIFRRQ